MSSSTIARSRSLRKPNPPAESSSAVPRSSRPAAPSDADHHGSPSRLPTKPPTRVPSTSSSNGGAAAKPAPRPLGRTLSSRQPADAPRTNSTRYPPTTGSTRHAPPPSGTLRPTSASSSSNNNNSASSTQIKRVASHARARSTASTNGATGLTPATTLKPPPQGTNLRTAAHAKTASMDRTRTASTSSTTTTARGAPAAAPAQAQSRLRPNFSTLQTHYSPAKSRDPKPLTATYLAPPSPSKLPANVAASAETSKLQTELLQLHLLHRDAATVEAQWRASAKQKLGARFEKACITAEQVAEQEKAGLERANVLALHAWGSEGGLEEKIQGLDTVFNGIWSLSEPGGRYARMARRFERWMDQVSEVEQARRDGTYLEQGDQSLFISDLETPWKEDCAGTLRRLDGWRHQLRVLGEPPADEDGTSSLAKMLQGARSLVQDMLAEVQMMEEMEEEALAREAEWIEKMNRMDDDDTPQAGAIWRTV